MINFREEDLTLVNSASFIPWDDLYECTIFITGATGLIGKALVKALCYVNSVRHLNLRMILLVRNLSAAKTTFMGIDGDSIIHFIVGNVESIPIIEKQVDYVIHCASKTSSEDFIKHAVETIQTTVYGVDNVLKLAREKQVKSLVFLSSMEVYGYPAKGHQVTENEIGQFEPTNLRNSYPISKILGETLCFSYWKEYGIPVKTIRLTQTVGFEVNQQDRRFPAYLKRCALEKKAIILKTTGKTERSYLYVVDAVTAIMTVLLKGKNGRIYNAADENTYCSISEMAERIANENGLMVVYDIQENSSDLYLDTLYMDLDTHAIRSLGWKPMIDE